MRIEWVDSVRGYALLAIMLTHFNQAATEVGTRGAHSLTLTQLGFSSAAELFVLCAGFGMSMALTRLEARKGVIGGFRWLLRRMGLIYGANLLSLLGSAAVVLLLIAPEHRSGTMFTFISNIAHTPVESLTRFALFGQATTLFGILNFYLLLLPFIWLQFQLLKTGYMAACLFSLALYVLVQCGLAPRAADMPAFSFNVWSWQILGLAGILLAKTESRLPQIFSTRRFIWLVAAFVACMVLKLLWFYGSQKWPWFAILRDKDDLGPLRAAHAILVMFMLREGFLYIRGVPPLSDWLRNTFGWLGRHSLSVFSAQNVLVYLGAAITLQAGATSATYWGVYAAILICSMIPATFVMSDPKRIEQQNHSK